MLKLTYASSYRRTVSDKQLTGKCVIPTQHRISITNTVLFVNIHTFMKLRVVSKFIELKLNPEIIFSNMEYMVIYQNFYNK